MNGGSDNNDKPNWLARNEIRILRLIRFGFAIGILIWVVIPLTSNGKTLVDKNISDFIPVTKTTGEFMLPTPAKKDDGNTTQQTGSPSDSIQAAIKAEMVLESASPRVWGYGLQLTAIFGALGVSLWAVVSLCRDE